MQDALKIFASELPPPSTQAGSYGSYCLPSMVGAADAFLALALTADTRLVLAITPGLPDAERLADDLTLLAAKSPVRPLELPPLLSDDRGALGHRLKTIAALKAWSIDPYPAIVIAPFVATQHPITADITPFTLGQTPLKFKAVCEKLSAYGYHRVPQVESEGDYSIRGGIVDVWSPGEDYPCRAEFFGDDLESLRRFNPGTQISIERIAKAELLPIATADSAADEHSFFELLPDAAVILALEHNAYSLDAALRHTHPIYYTGDPAPAGVPGHPFPISPLPGFAELGADEAHHPELFEAASQRLQQHLAAAERHHDHILHLDDLSGGFELPGLIVVTKADRVFTKRHLSRHHGHNAALMQGPRLSDFDNLEPGEYVVHVDCGVGRYLGSREIFVNGRRSEVFTIEYADGGKLHIPADHAHLLSRYVGVKGEAVHLHRLDGKRWAKDKQDAQQAISDLAMALLETQAKRETVPGFAYHVDCEGLAAFEAAFPFDETADQDAAIAAIKRDLAATKPMDRLICGDAGYGKTEVAMRAAYIAALNGKQVAVLTPTTVLAEQHFESFTSRFDGTPIRIESVSRFQSDITHRGTFKRLATGACDIVIGTHAILSDKIAFHDLGLIIIDEEQRFGVRHKEFLKRLRATADVLTLSATPIPRTLYLSMTGARDLSLLRTPPVERVAVDTRIVRDADETIVAAIETELARDGQVFFLHNRVQSIGIVEKRLHTLCPKARIVVAHGQMDSRTLAKKMRDFERGNYDVLLSTTIIESGIDIPRANTIIVSDAQMFGMADLYQLRGRVGRSSRQGYAYFLLPPSGIVDSEARERLAALKKHSSLGAGFNLAVRDLELRGAGNLLGSKQSGHIAAIGFTLYCQLLQRTIAMLKGEKVMTIVDVTLNLDFVNPRLPAEYIEEDVLRMSLFKRFAEAQNLKTVKALAAEMVDRFGAMPPEAAEYVKIAELRILAATAGIGVIDVKDDRAVFYRSRAEGVAFVRDLKGSTSAAKIRELAACLRDSAKISHAAE